MGMISNATRIARANRTRTLMGACALVAGLAACVVGSFTTQATRLTVVDKNDVPRGDEPYMATIRFRSAYASADSTSVIVEDSLTTLGDQVRPGQSVNIPAAIGRADFGQISVLDRQDIKEMNRSPGIGGVFYVMMEEDHGGKNVVRQKVRERAERLRELLVEHVATKSWSDLAVPLSLKAINDGLAELEGGGGCGLFKKGLCNFFRNRLGDDFIDFNGLIYVGIDNRHFEELEPRWRAVAELFGQTWPSCDSLATPICPAASNENLLEFAGSGGRYRLQVVTTFQN